jgi:hypothetical protein
VNNFFEIKKKYFICKSTNILGKTPKQANKTYIFRTLEVLFRQSISSAFFSSLFIPLARTIYLDISWTFRIDNSWCLCINQTKQSWPACFLAIFKLFGMLFRVTKENASFFTSTYVSSNPCCSMFWMYSVKLASWTDVRQLLRSNFSLQRFPDPILFSSKYEQELCM